MVMDKCVCVFVCVLCVCVCVCVCVARPNFGSQKWLYFKQTSRLRKSRVIQKTFISTKNLGSLNILSEFQSLRQSSWKWETAPIFLSLQKKHSKSKLSFLQQSDRKMETMEKIDKNLTSFSFIET